MRSCAATHTWLLCTPSRCFPKENLGLSILGHLLGLSYIRLLATLEHHFILNLISLEIFLLKTTSKLKFSYPYIKTCLICL